MPRRKLSEFRAKHLVASAVGLDYVGWSITGDDAVPQLPDSQRFVVKVDQAVKKRFKNGLVFLNITPADIEPIIADLRTKGYDSFIVEPYQEHEHGVEYYLNLRRTSNGLQLTYSENGGVDIEDASESLQTTIIDGATDWNDVSEKTKLSTAQLKSLITLFDDQFATLIEINPYCIRDGQPVLLDIALEVDDAGSYANVGWSVDDMRMPPRKPTPQERSVIKLKESSPASFMLQVINPHGAIFVLLSGGGASIVVADEIYSSGAGEQLANYGEYSGNPTTEETFVYASAVIELLIQSSAPKKMLFIGGAVANFTNIEKTFAGVIQAIRAHGSQLQKQDIKVVVRRGGPHQEEGLKNIQDVLESYDLLGEVYDQSMSLSGAVQVMLKGIDSAN